MTENIVKKEDAPIKKPFNYQEMRKEALGLGFGFEPNSILKELDKKLAEIVGKNKGTPEDEDSQKLFRNAIMIMGLENHFALAMAVKEDYRPLAIEFANILAKEYDCGAPSEKALVQVVVNSYIRLIDDSRRYNNCSDGGEYISRERTNHLAILSKQMDRANRQFISALATLKQIKSPPIQVSVRTNTAFIAQNQQLNQGQITNK